MIFATFKKIFTAAALASLVAGVLLTLIQQLQVIPLILEAEVYEQAKVANGDVYAEYGQTQNHPSTHKHSDEREWQPQEGFSRNLFTAFANIVVALGFSLLLGAGAFLRDTKLDWRSGLLWGLAGYVVFFVAPSLGMPPELPGSHGPNLEHRQLWWMITVVCTGFGLAFVFFNTQNLAKIFGIVLIVTPHIVGAPQTGPHIGTAPAESIQAFIIATSIANAVFWLSMGGFYGFFYKKLAS
uniref:Cobalt transporter subunit CbtA n=1 Tax=Candidatus Kentrum sp. LFY TaxID=2126342 RepID=A0A450V5M8_9GAMM|nr:MAG: cobalt transporter subunit CbtA [Candidatus Kentron sp. LFY]VFK00125.1 MAG: cobalt transporter subunit CbtA [Candidatus Kentron sp. LFY]